MTATSQARTDRSYRGVVYGFDLIIHESWMSGGYAVAHDDYVGKTRQRGRRREMQHRDDKPWSDLIVGSSHVLWEGICTEEELDDIERRFIREKKPRMNDKDNRWNAGRISYETQVSQRHERDARRGDPPWQPPENRNRDSLLEWDEAAPGVPAVAVRRPWKPWQKQLLGWSIAWLVLMIAGWVGLERWRDFGAWWHPAAVAGVALLALLSCLRLWTWLGAPVTKAQWRRKWREKTKPKRVRR
ncbi:hypothetical protein Ade02nite_19970 [Paractinoplanes deccanensis]|uniref:GIY-YIG nuclease family protein n=1 Tax=Paractinoplanes deccanensis TaxID=113561 RepID=A0ABQ3Y029_9ACTN|nr:hypothetical protein [Actinoplanes deccanensis]GID73356.1 hypothetical protein Ade02nite_19970 [Actinoplanes deccanensis]